MQPFRPRAPSAATPGSSPTADGQEQVWRDGSVVVAAHGARWPDRCIRCNAPAEGYRKQLRLSWHTPWLFLLIPVGFIVYALVALYVRKTADVAVGVCAPHRRRRSIGLAVGWLGALATVATCTANIEASPPIATGLGFLGVIVSIVVGFALAQLLSVKKIDDFFLWLGCGQPFVQSLQQSPYHADGRIALRRRPPRA